MQRSSRQIMREIGTAFAVLAIYLLTILTPLHQARASQLTFESLGYTTLSTGWALCGAPATDHSNANLTKCPVTGAGKQGPAAPAAAAVLASGPVFATTTITIAPAQPVRPRTLNLATSPRGPPISA